MKEPIELLVKLYSLYTDGKLAAEFDKNKNKMKNSDELIEIMTNVEKLVPPKLKPMQAAQAMCDLENREELIDINKTKVIDMRKEFLKRMSANGGALGLTKKLVEALDNNDLLMVGMITMEMQELVKQSD